MTRSPGHRRPWSLRTRGVVACAAATVALSGCGTGPVTVTAPVPTGADAEACQRLLDALPDEIADRERREVEVTDEGGVAAAWGSPPVVLRCGGTLPDSYVLGATCVQADGVDWYVPDDELFVRDDVDLTMTTVGYRPLVQVSIPGELRQQVWAATMSRLAPVIKQLEYVGPCDPAHGGEPTD